MNLNTTYSPIDAYYTIIYKPMNREEKRKFTFETDKVIRELFPIDAAFLTDLFVRDRDYHEALRNNDPPEGCAAFLTSARNDFSASVRLPSTSNR